MCVGGGRGGSWESKEEDTHECSKMFKMLEYFQIGIEL